jgi:ABC-type nitrate/sulfonate/bicarbonate transport system substrate-binding protein
MIWLKIITAAVLSGSLFGLVETVLPPRPAQPFTIEVSDWPGDQVFALIGPLGLDRGVPIVFDVRRTPPSRDPVEAFRNGLADAVMIGLDRLPDLIPDRIRVIYAVDEVTGDGGLVAGPGIGRAADLAHHKIGVAFGSTAEPLARSLLDRAGVDPQDVTLVPLAPDDGVAALQSGRVAAVAELSPTRLALLQRLPGTTLLASTQDQAGLVTHVLVVRESWVSDQRDRLEAVIRTLSATVDLCRKATDRCLEAMAAASGRPAEAWRQDFETVRLLDLSNNQALLAGGADAPIARRLAAVQALMSRHREAPPPPEPSWFDPSPVQEAARS